MTKFYHKCIFKCTYELYNHHLFYTSKLKVPDQEIDELQEQFGMVPLTKEILDRALEGPTDDLEDNIQLHSAIEADCEAFLTADQNLLKLAIFGKTKITSEFLEQ